MHIFNSDGVLFKICKVHNIFNYDSTVLGYITVTILYYLLSFCFNRLCAAHIQVKQPPCMTSVMAHFSKRVPFSRKIQHRYKLSSTMMNSQL